MINKDFTLNRYDAEIKKIMAHPIQESKILLIGSSFFTKWGYDRVINFSNNQILNHGFGGAVIDEILYYYNKIILPYNPSKIILRAGLNDLFKELTPIQTFFLYERLIEWIHTDFPNCEIYYILNFDVPVLAGTRDFAKTPKEEFNRLIIEHSEQTSYVKIVDINDFFYQTPSDVGTYKNFKPFFLEDGLHIDENGYSEFETYFKKVLLDNGIMGGNL